MNYSVIGEPPNTYPQPSLRNLRSLVSTISTALELLPPDADEVVPVEFAYNLDHLTMLTANLDRTIPQVGPVWACGYPWGVSARAWTTWSAHEDRKTAERWLAAWRTSKVGRPEAWEVRQVEACRVDRFMPKGTRIATVMGKLG